MTPQARASIRHNHASAEVEAYRTGGHDYISKLAIRIPDGPPYKELTRGSRNNPADRSHGAHL